jgi:hypothetical protein
VFNRAIDAIRGSPIQSDQNLVRRILCRFSIKSALRSPRVPLSRKRERERERERKARRARVPLGRQRRLKSTLEYEILPTRAVADLARFGAATRADGSRSLRSLARHVADGDVPDK